MKAVSRTFQAGTKYTCFIVLKFSQKQQFYPYPYKNQEKEHFWHCTTPSSTNTVYEVTVRNPLGSILTDIVFCIG